MTQISMAQMLGRTISSLLDPHETVDILSEIVTQCAALYPADAVAVLVSDRRGDLEPLVATSHRARHLEVLQAQRAVGPCVDVLRRGVRVSATGPEMAARWGEVGQEIVAAGFDTVHAYPLTWRGRPLGGLNVFASSPGDPTEDTAALGQLFADLVTLVVVQSTQISDEQVSARLHEAITTRSAVEQAKGLLAYQHDVDVAAAYDLLVATAHESGETMTATAHRLIRSAHERS